MNAPIRRLSTVIALLFAALLVSSTLIQVVNAGELRARPDNKRTLYDNYSRSRGSIYVGETAIAKSTATDDTLGYLRTYPQPKLYSHVTGYFSFTYGANGGIEGDADDLLSGSSDALFYRRVSDFITGRKPQGANLLLTINAKAQKAASAGLGNQRGAVVALDPQTGAILAMVSHPQFDPNTLTTHDDAAVESAWESLNDDKTRPLVNRGIAGDLYPPGSVFKIVTATAALENGIITESSSIPAPGVMDLPQTSVGLPNYDRRPCGPGNQTNLENALIISCNTAFGYLGLQLGDDALRQQAAKFGFGDVLRVPMRVTPSVVPADMNPPQTAQAAIGQYDVRVTPLQMAMVSGAVANDGVVMRPYLIAQVLGANLEQIDTTRPEQLSQAMSRETSDTLTRMLVRTVNAGTGQPAVIPGVDVAGKTGTAQQGNDKPPHAWFTAFAPADDPQIAVAVVVEDGGNAGNEAAGGRLAGPIAKRVIEAVLSR